MPKNRRALSEEELANRMRARRGQPPLKKHNHGAEEGLYHRRIRVFEGSKLLLSVPEGVGFDAYTEELRRLYSRKLALELGAFLKELDAEDILLRKAFEGARYVQITSWKSFIAPRVTRFVLEPVTYTVAHGWSTGHRD